MRLTTKTVRLEKPNPYFTSLIRLGTTKIRNANFNKNLTFLHILSNFYIKYLFIIINGTIPACITNIVESQKQLK